MQTQGQQLARAAFAAMIALVLGFGATQAVAATAQPGGLQRSCDHFQCDQYCVGNGFSYGECRIHPLRCECFY